MKEISISTCNNIFSLNTKSLLLCTILKTPAGSCSVASSWDASCFDSFGLEGLEYSPFRPILNCLYLYYLSLIFSHASPSTCRNSLRPFTSLRSQNHSCILVTLSFRGFSDQAFLQVPNDFQEFPRGFSSFHRSQHLKLLKWIDCTSVWKKKMYINITCKNTAGLHGLQH